MDYFIDESGQTALPEVNRGGSVGHWEIQHMIVAAERNLGYGIGQVKLARDTSATEYNPTNVSGMIPIAGSYSRSMTFRRTDWRDMNRRCHAHAS